MVCSLVVGQIPNIDARRASLGFLLLVWSMGQTWDTGLCPCTIDPDHGKLIEYEVCGVRFVQGFLCASALSSARDVQKQLVSIGLGSSRKD